VLHAQHNTAALSGIEFTQSNKSVGFCLAVLWWTKPAIDKAVNANQRLA
jgi:hypothetical protein